MFSIFCCMNFFKHFFCFWKARRALVSCFQKYESASKTFNHAVSYFHLLGLGYPCSFLLTIIFFQLVLVNPGGEVMKKLNKSKSLDLIGQEWIFLTVGEAVRACNFMLHSCKPNPNVTDESEKRNDNNVWITVYLRIKSYFKFATTILYQNFLSYINNTVCI